MSFDILDRLAEVNPYPEGSETPDSILSAAATRAVIDDRRRDMKTQERNTTNVVAAPSRRRRGVLIAAAAFVAVLVVGASIALFSTGEPSEVATTPPPPATTEAAPHTTAPPPTTSVTWTDAEEEEAMAIVQAGLALLNSSDSDAWADFREPLRPDVVQEITADIHAALHAAGAQYEIDSCDIQGPRDDLEWAGPGFVIACDTTRSDAYGDAFDWNVRERFTVVVKPNRHVIGSDWLNNTDGLWNIFLRDFRDWLEETHPDVHAQITYASYEDGILPDAASAELALQYLDEYAATRE